MSVIVKYQVTNDYFCNNTWFKKLNKPGFCPKFGYQTVLDMCIGVKSKILKLPLPLMLLGLMLLSACSTVPPKQAAAPEQPAAAEPEKIKIVKVEPVRPKIPLTGDLLYKIMLAEIAGQRGYLDISLQNYLELARETRDPEIVERATRIAVYARDQKAAAEAAKLWVELDPRNPDAHQVLAVMALRAGDLDQTLEHLQDILKYTEGNLNQKLWMVVNLLGRERDRDMVMQVMEKLLAGRENEPDAVFAFANIAARMGKYDRALELLKHVMEMDPDNDNAALSYISILQRVDRTNDALKWLEQTLAKRKNNDFNLRMAYARLLTDAQRFDDARHQFELLSVSAPKNTDVLYALGLLYLQANRLDDAQAEFKRLTDLNDRFDNAKYYLGRIAEERKDYQTANVWYEGVQSGENHFDAQIRMGMLKAKMGDIDGARALLKKIPTSSAKEFTLLTQAEAELLIDEKSYDQAMEVYNRALEGTSYNADLLYSRAMLAEKMGKLDILERDLLRIITREPNHAQALNALGYTLADRTDRYQEAYSYIKRALELSPKDFYILDSMGWVLYRMGRMDEAKSYLRKAMDIRDDPEIAAHLVEVLWVTGEEKEAKKVWETALQETPGDSHLLNVIERFSPKDLPRH